MTPDDERLLRMIARRVRAVRVARGLTQEQLAEAAGMSRNFVSSIERGRRGVEVLRLRRIGVALGVSLIALLDETADDAKVVLSNNQ